MARKYFAWDLIKSFRWDCIFLAFFPPIFKSNFWEVLQPPGAHLNLISSFSSSITISNNVKRVHTTAVTLYSCSSFDHMGLKLGGIVMRFYASLPLLFSQDYKSTRSPHKQALLWRLSSLFIQIFKQPPDLFSKHLPKRQGDGSWAVGTILKVQCEEQKD